MRKSLVLSVLVAFVLVIGFGTFALAGKPKPPGGGPGPIGGCPKDFYCLDVWDPVVCADGITYSNQCYADRACAPGPCVPGDGGPVEL
jgi:hypothetical protein